MFGFRREEVLDINKVASEREKDSLLIDVREPDEYEEGHLPGSINIPVDTIKNTELNCSKEKRIYVYCLSGMRALRAVKQLRNMGYLNVKNIGGINSYTGRKVK